MFRFEVLRQEDHEFRRSGQWHEIILDRGGGGENVAGCTCGHDSNIVVVIVRKVVYSESVREEAGVVSIGRPQTFQTLLNLTSSLCRG